MPEQCRCYQEYQANIISWIEKDILEAYPHLKNKHHYMLAKMLQDTRDSFIFILDEWDSVFYRKFMTRDDRHSYLFFLKNILKDHPYVELAYMTGILPIAKYSSGSELNMFRKTSFMNDHKFDTFFGCTDDEVMNLCINHRDISYEALKYWYDGYRMSSSRSLFNPRSVNFALGDGILPQLLDRNRTNE